MKNNLYDKFFAGQGQFSGYQSRYSLSKKRRYCSL